MYKYNAKVSRVVDGDTVDALVDLGFDTWKHVRIRMMGLNAPESRTRDLEEKFYGKASKAHLQSILAEGDIELQSHGKGKFGRILGELFVGSSSYSVNQQMIDEYHAVPYLGQNKADIEQGHLWNRAALNEQGVIYEADV